jgi:hypothetical protein
MARATTHIRKTLMLMRSERPAQGVGRFSWTEGAVEAVIPPNRRRAAIVTIEYQRNHPRIAEAPNAMAACG